jgi:HAD superfamily hydrolase (TIGR01490 family)
MKLALFDLDHTLIPFDSGLTWIRFLTRRGALGPDTEASYLGYARQYMAGTLDIHAMHRAMLAPLTRFARAELAAWALEYEATMAPRVPAEMRALVQAHLDAGDLCAIVTATERLVAQPFARLFGVPHLVATEAATVDGSADGALTGEMAGEPCYRAHKITRVQRWLAQDFEPARTLQSFEQSWFYSDSASDLPLLQAVTHPVAVRPDEKLLAHARQQGWPVWPAPAPA